jgi:poly(beta-D-mannuronate) lyase
VSQPRFIYRRPGPGLWRVVATGVGVSLALAVAAFKLTQSPSAAAALTSAVAEQAEPPPRRTIPVSSLEELKAKIESAVPGDRIVVKNGVYTTTEPIKVAKQGEAGQRIVIAAETVGGVEIKGSAGFELESPAAYVTLQGFKFTHAIGTVQVRAGTRHCRLTRNVFELTGEGRYLLVSGDDCEIDRNTFQNKKTGGPMFSIHGPGRAGMAQRTHVHHNLFQNFTSIGRNGGETLQIGLSGKSLTDAHSIVERNLFLRCNGENEAISNKSGANIYRYNTFRDMVGELTLRHGNRCSVYGNYFFNTHGIRFFGDDHKIYSNYFEGCDPAVQIGNGGTKIPPGELTGHDQPERVRFTFNTLVNNKRHVVMGGRTNGLGAVDLVFANNILQGEAGSLLTLGGPLMNPTFAGNLVWGAATDADLPSGGAKRIAPGLVKDASGLFRLSGVGAAKDAATGSYEEVTVDMDGQPRTGAKDVGADEFSGGPIIHRPLTVADVGPNAP